MPVVAVLVVVLSELAVPGPVSLHHVAVLQPGRSLLLLRTLFAAVRGVAPHGVAARQRRARHLLTVNFSRGPLEMENRIIFTVWVFFSHLYLKSGQSLRLNNEKFILPHSAWQRLNDPLRGSVRRSGSNQMSVGVLMCIYLASADGTFNVAKGGHKGMPGGSWSVHLLVSFEVATCGGREVKVHINAVSR